MRNWDYEGLSKTWSSLYGGSEYHIADVLTAASESVLLTLVIDANEKGFSAGGTRTIVVLVALCVVV